ncbi:DUF4145 domain-containing protein [Acinetobacter baumannii]|uniref:DUF4145 domain-containing protein n=1 Tax=Acinetobacter TaxID=469 RepID=UPI000400BB46|nr:MULTISPECIES: DUF4145 domain-containing protein [Acinetobacter]KAF6701245.1 DUF4145 domain-containing protein [Acinetobacter sp. EKM10A]MDN8364623.1 DUF4145 domain-containing protein [Acinetobacter baumannii]MDV7514004.1 DUF4145 domain-containing protein [Acinetobacter baumannii]
MNLVAPKIRLKSFHCPFCNVYSSMSWDIFKQESEYILSFAQCLHCNESSIWRENADKSSIYIKKYHEGMMVYPTSEINILPSEDMPSDVREDFNEARTIYYKSPRAAAALLRLALQKLCIHLGQSGKNINTDIGNLVSEGIINRRIQKAADTVRIVGNNAVHPSEMDDQDIDKIAEKLFSLINMIVYSAITEPKEVDETFNKTPQGARDAIEKRDNH